MNKRKVIVIDDALSTEDTESFRDQHKTTKET